MRNVECAACGAPFQTTHAQKKTCSTPCQQEWQRVRTARNYAANHERINQNRRETYAEDSEKVLAANKAWRDKNRDDLNARKRADYAADPEKYLIPNKAWRDANRDKVNTRRRMWWHECSQERIAEAQQLKPVLDRLTLTPENREKIEIMVDYIQSDEYLTFVLDWYWMADAIEYLERN